MQLKSVSMLISLRTNNFQLFTSSLPLSPVLRLLSRSISSTKEFFFFGKQPHLDHFIDNWRSATDERLDV